MIPFRVSEELLPPQLRNAKMLAWLRVLFRPIQYCADLFWRDFLEGANYDDYNNATAYAFGDRVVWYNRSVYELRVTSSTGVKPTGDPLSKTNWLFLQKNYTGAETVVKYTGQRITLEAAINQHFNVTVAPFIYTVTAYSTATILIFYVPAAVWAAIGNNDDERYAAIFDFFNRYIPYDVARTYSVY